MCVPRSYLAIVDARSQLLRQGRKPITLRGKSITAWGFSVRTHLSFIFCVCTANSHLNFAPGLQIGYFLADLVVYCCFLGLAGPSSHSVFGLIDCFVLVRTQQPDRLNPSKKI